jgi:integrase
MLCVAYETLARRGELVALAVKDIDFHPDGTGIALIRRGKTDAEGQGRSAYLSRETVRWLKIWLDHAGISEGTLFRRLIGQNQIGGPLNPGSIAPIFKRVAQWIGIPERFVEQVSGHSTRVGATQDLSALGIDLAAITQAGGWKSTRMPLQYAEKIAATLAWREPPKRQEGPRDFRPQRRLCLHRLPYRHPSAKRKHSKRRSQFCGEAIEKRLRQEHRSSVRCAFRQ